MRCLGYSLHIQFSDNQYINFLLNEPKKKCGTKHDDNAIGWPIKCTRLDE